VLRSWGASTFSMPHMITVDRDGAVWVADTGLHQVLKFNDAGRLLLTLGQKFQPGSDKTHLCKPAHVSGCGRADTALHAGPWMAVSCSFCHRSVADSCMQCHTASVQWGMFTVHVTIGLEVLSLCRDSTNKHDAAACCRWWS
jgi:hypothetical protein